MEHLQGAQSRGLQTPRRWSGHFWGCPLLGPPHAGPRVPSCQVRALTRPGGACLPPLQSCVSTEVLEPRVARLSSGRRVKPGPG